MKMGTWWVSRKHAWNRHRHWPDQMPRHNSYWRVILSVKHMTLYFYFKQKFIQQKYQIWEKGKNTHRILRVILQRCVIETDFCLGINSALLHAKRDEGRLVREAACCTLNKQRTPQPRAVIPKIKCIHFTAFSEVWYEHLFYLNIAASSWC